MLKLMKTKVKQFIKKHESSFDMLANEYVKKMDQFEK